MEMIALVAVLFITGYVLTKVHARRKLSFIENYKFSEAFENKFRAVRPELTVEQEKLVFEALRQYFLFAAWQGGGLSHAITSSR